MPLISQLPSVPADDPSHLDFPVVGKPFHADLTSTSYGDRHVPLDEVIHSPLNVDKTTVSMSKQWHASLYIYDHDKKALEYVLHSRPRSWRSCLR
jgi:hypothetical protein